MKRETLEQLEKKIMEINDLIKADPVGSFSIQGASEKFLNTVLAELKDVVWREYRRDN